MATNSVSAPKKTSVFQKIARYPYLGLIIGLILILVVAWFLTPKMFTYDGIISMFRNNSIYAILTAGMMLVLITGGIDLSVASILAMTGIFTSKLTATFPDVPGFVWLIVGLLIGAIAGLINGLMIGKLRIIPFIATLGTMYIYRGLAFVVSGGKWFFPQVYGESYTWWATGTLIPTIPNLVLIVVVVLVLVGLFLGYTKSGRRVYAIGTSRESSHVAGIKDGNVELMVYTINGALCGMAGMLYTANYVLGYYGMADSFEMTAIAICILGGVSITGGRGRMDGVVISILIMSVIYNFTSMLPGLSVWQKAIQGAIIIVAVFVNVASGKLSDKRALKERGALI
ncbi:ABC transporter permease [Massilioclostridium coli]|uniref:ABC transporter permease n=1 Tax=Massilioclostridium coli TaxID=1870991 RepID=UPI0009F4C56B|nr:ABC transporter permease [Massilioclostridium coli]